MLTSDNGVDVDGTNARMRGPNDARPRLIVDVTDLVGGMPNGVATSGIPRVVVEFAKAGILLAREQNIPFVLGCLDQATNDYYYIEPESGDDAGNARSINGIFSSELFRKRSARPVNLTKVHVKYANKPVKRYWHLTSGRLQIALRRRATQMARAFKAPWNWTRMEFRQGDIFLMLGSGWDVLPLFDLIVPLEKSGIIEPVILVHDIIPMLSFYRDHPDVRIEGVAQVAVFRAWFERAILLTDRFLTVSDATRKDLLAKLHEMGRPSPQVRVACLPHEFNRPVSTTLSPAIRDLLKQNYALFVGPVSGRKNARRLLEAWAAVLKRVGPEKTPLLVITGQRGADEVYDTHIGPIASHVRVLNRPNDFELSQLYAHAAFTVFPSLYEGWGLPVGESLWHGTPCITSNVSSLPEVGGPLCDYVDPNSVDSIAAAVERFATDPAYRDSRAEAIKGAKLRSWRDFAQDVIDAAKAYADEPGETQSPPARSASGRTA